MPRLEQMPSSFEGVTPEAEQVPQEEQSSETETSIHGVAYFMKLYEHNETQAVDEAFEYLLQKFEHGEKKSRFGVTEYFWTNRGEKDDLLFELLQRMPADEKYTEAFTDLMQNEHLTEDEENLIRGHIQILFESMKKEKLQ